MRALGLAVLLGLVLAAPAGATPVLGAEVPVGSGSVVALPDRAAPHRVVDGRVGDWPGRLPPYAGALDYSHGTLVYRDHIFDAYGPDNGQDAERLGVLDPATEDDPELFRLDPAYQYVPGEFGVPTGPLDPEVHYGDLKHVDQADLSQVRLGTDRRRNLWLLARTTTMTDASTALLVLLDTTPGDHARTVPYNSGGLVTHTGDVAVFLNGDRGSWTDLATGAVHAFSSVATNPTGYTNAIEARIPRAAFGGRTVGVMVAAGLADGDHLKTLSLQPNLANVAFRTTEPARDWFDKRQALDLYLKTVDRDFVTANLGRMARGANQRYLPGPGYHDRIFRSDPRISKETGDSGILQHYGVYLPTSYRAGTPSPVQWWFHFRGGNAHIAAAVVPGIFRDMGAAHDSVVITPDGRGERGWYVGKSQLDYREVWRDAHHLLSLDRNREYIAGHSMGGWASYLLPVLYPDRFAATFPASGPATQGAWLGCTGSDVCYQQANDGNAQAELTTPLLGNLRNVPVTIYQGTDDELVPVAGVVAQANRLQSLGLRYRLYLFPHQEHYGPPIQDEWTEGAAYEHSFVRDPNPGRVTYTRSMAFEHAVNTVNSDKVVFGFHFNHAYWMSGLQPVDPVKGVAAFDGTDLARPEVPHTLATEVGGPSSAGQTGPYEMTGQAWHDDIAARPAARNGFAITLTGARAVRLATRRMGLDQHRRAFGEVKTSAPLRLTLRGRYRHATLDGRHVHFRRGVIRVPAGTHHLALRR